MEAFFVSKYWINYSKVDIFAFFFIVLILENYYCIQKSSTKSTPRWTVSSKTTNWEPHPRRVYCSETKQTHWTSKNTAGSTINWSIPLRPTKRKYLFSFRAQFNFTNRLIFLFKRTLKSITFTCTRPIRHFSREATRSTTGTTRSAKVNSSSSSRLRRCRHKLPMVTRSSSTCSSVSRTCPVWRKTKIPNIKSCLTRTIWHLKM